jgi:uncharacterized RmlC-like cupin family protein
VRSPLVVAVGASAAINVHDGLSEGLWRFLRQVVADAACDEPMLIPATHPEIIYVTKGSWGCQVEGRSSVTLKAGEVLFIPAGAVHSASNVGSSIGKELATYIVEKGKPLPTLAR